MNNIRLMPKLPPKSLGSIADKLAAQDERRVERMARDERLVNALNFAFAIPKTTDLNNEGAVTLALLAAGYRSAQFAELLSEIITAAKRERLRQVRLDQGGLA